MTLKEIKDLVYPKETVDWIEVLKELVIKKFGENKLIDFDSVYLYPCGDCSEYVWGVAVIDNKLFALTDDGEGYDCEFGTAYFGNGVSKTKGIGLTENAIKIICKLIFEEKLGRGCKTPIAFDFSKMEGKRLWFEDYFMKRIKNQQEKFDSFVNGSSCGYINIT
jgi:hypothetical protein